MIYDLIGVLITISSKRNEKKPPIASEAKHGLDQFDDQVKPIMKGLTEQIHCFEAISDILLNADHLKLDY